MSTPTAGLSKLILILLGVVACVVIALAHPPKEPTLGTRFGPLITKTNDEYLLQAVEAKPQHRIQTKAMIELVWPAENLGVSYKNIRDNLQSQASNWAARECQMLLKTLASECRVTTATADSWAESAILRLQLDLVTKDAFLPAADTQPRWLDSMDLAYSNDEFSPGIKQDAEAAAAVRARIYAEMHRDCREAHDVYRNCLLYRIHLNSALFGTPRNHRIGVKARASIAVVRDDGWTD